MTVLPRKGISYWDGHSVFKVRRPAITAWAQTVDSPHKPTVTGGLVPVVEMRLNLSNAIKLADKKGLAQGDEYPEWQDRI